MQPQDHTHFPRIPLVGSRNVWQDQGVGKATVAQAPSAASITPSLALSPPPKSLWVAWLVTHQAPPASDQERAAVAFPGGLDGGSEARKLTTGTIRSVHLGAQEFQWRCLRDWQVGWG